MLTMNTEISQDVMRGQQVYNKFTLAVYDVLLFKILTGPVWGLSTKRLLTLYNDNITSNHLDVGVGSGFLLDNCKFPSLQPNLALMDLNQDCLTHSSKRLQRYKPKQYRRNILAPITIDARGFDSISMNYLLHCLPGTITEKMVVFENLYQLLNPGGVIFGATIIPDSSNASWIAKKLMKIYNKKGVFCNAGDNIQTFENLLSAQYENVELTVIGNAAQFIIHKPLVMN
jgi:ubiquinone/menaquinone biosynthesis C-methylase UbiE